MTALELRAETPAAVIELCERAVVIIQECDRAADAVILRAQAKGITEVVRARKLGNDALAAALRLRLRTERRTGQLLVADGAKPGQRRNIGQTYIWLEDVGLSLEQSSAFRKLAALDDEEFERALGVDVERLSLQAIIAAVRGEPAGVDTPPFPADKYRCIVIDPPWPTKKVERHAEPTQGDHLDYPTMSLDKIAALPVGNLAADGCHVYLWVTHHFLPAGLELLDTWGARYECQLTWRKNVGMTPFSWMYDTEHVLFARIGSLELERKGLRLSIDAPAVGHSVKPDAFYDRVREASPEPRLDMFARAEHEAFEPWGADV